MATRGVEVVLLQGARTPAELLYGDEFRAFAAQHPDHFRFVPCFSRELPAPVQAEVQPFHSDLGPLPSLLPSSRPLSDQQVVSWLFLPRADEAHS